MFCIKNLKNKNILAHDTQNKIQNKIVTIDQKHEQIFISK